MLLEDADIKEFQALYEQEFGEPIEEGEARLLATKLITLYETLSRPLQSEKTQFTDSIYGSRLNVEVGPNQPDKTPTSEKVVL